MLVALQLVGVASAPLKLTVPVPCAEPKLVPLMVTEVPTIPEVTERLLMLRCRNYSEADGVACHTIRIHNDIPRRCS